MSILSRPPEKIRRKKRVKIYAHNAGACAKYSRKYSLNYKRAAYIAVRRGTLPRRRY